MTDFRVASSHTDQLSDAERLRMLDLIEEQLDDVEDFIPQRDNAEPAPLSLAQQRLWLLEQMLEGRPVYHIPLVLRLEGPLHLHALQQALHEMVQRHEVLRTTFMQVGDQPFQLITPDAEIPLQTTDLRDVPANEREQTALRLMKTEVQRPFDLEWDLPLRAHLIQLDEQLHIFGLIIHHIASDGWTMGLLRTELATIYSALVQGESWSLPELPIQYADFAVWQRQQDQRGLLEENLAYWRAQLADLAEWELPTDHPRPTTFGYQGAVFSAHWPREVSEQLARFSRQEGTSLYMTLLAAFQIVLARYSGQNDIAIGSAFASRTRSEIESLAGFFVNTVVMRTRLEGTASFRQVLTQVRETTLEAYAHQEMPFDQLVEALQPRRDPSRSPLIQVVLTMQNAPSSSLAMPNLAVEKVPLDLGISRFDMSMNVIEQPGQGISFEIEYSTELFEAATIERLVGHLQMLVQAALQNPEQPIAQLPLLTAAERHQVLFDWNATAAPYPDTATIPELFVAQVQRTPQAPAVFWHDRSLSYQELWQRASQLSAYLRQQGVGPEVLVGLCVERSFEMIVGLFGILLAGGAYVPLDPNYPSERLQFMLQDTQTPLVLTQEALCARLAAVPTRLLCLDRDWPQIQAVPEEALSAPELTPENLAYVIYTSGSTGKPKGTLLTQRAVCNFTASTIRLFEVGAQDRVLQFANICFDVSVFEIFTALLSGAQLFLTDYETIISPPALTHFLQEQAITIVDIPPAVLSLLPGDALPSIRIALIGGESFTGELANRWLWPGRRFFNGYGPTESTVTMTLMECRQRSEQTPPIGYPMPNHRVYVLDGSAQPVPIGVPGQLYIGGAGLARGYLHQPDLTAARFVADPFSGSAGARLYSSGDLVRYRPDGALEFLGRIDQQVKIRGFRIELGEIEAMLSRHPAVRQVVVLARTEPETGQKELVGYLAGQPGVARPGTSELRTWLKQSLPTYMVPGLFMWVEQIPLTPSGKVNQAALPEPQREGQTKTAPRSRVEQLLLEQVFEKVLNVKGIGVDDNFFELGGNSLQATQLSLRIQETFQVELPVRTFFESQTVADLAELIQAQVQSRVEEEQEQLQLLTEIEQLSDEEIEKLLQETSHEQNG